MSLDKTTIKRIANDVKYLLNNKNNLENENIYYKHSDSNILTGYALIIGNIDTPYLYGYYFFKFDFPENYPFSPPKVTFLTNDGKMRFNPNYYSCGKVCLSLLNTWKGDGWTSCQTIYSVLIVLSSVLNSNPLLNEPGININDLNLEKYNFLVEYKNYQFSIIKQLDFLKKFNKSNNQSNNQSNNKSNNQSNNESNNESNNINKKYNDKKTNEYYNIILNFEEIMKISFNKNKEKIKNSIDSLENKFKTSYLNKNNNNIYINIYNLNEKIDFERIKNKFISILNDSFYKIE